jgi:L-lactate utilization protein LutC
VNREAFLARVRQALGRAEGDPVAPPPPPAAGHVVAPSMAGVGPAVVLDRFLERCAANGVEVRRAPDAEAAVPLAAGWLRELGVSAVADATPLAASVVAASGMVSTDAAASDIGVTHAWRGVAETGTVVLRSEDGRLAGLLPPVHLVLLAAEDLRPGLTEVYTDLADQGGPPAALIQVTGPSRTADIEVTLVTGVHGPGTVAVLLIG